MNNYLNDKIAVPDVLRRWLPGMLCSRGQLYEEVMFKLIKKMRRQTRNKLREQHPSWKEQRVQASGTGKDFGMSQERTEGQRNCGLSVQIHRQVLPFLLQVCASLQRVKFQNECETQLFSFRSFIMMPKIFLFSAFLIWTR